MPDYLHVKQSSIAGLQWECRAVPQCRALPMSGPPANIASMDAGRWRLLSNWSRPNNLCLRGLETPPVLAPSPTPPLLVPAVVKIFGHASCGREQSSNNLGNYTTWVGLLACWLSEWIDFSQICGRQCKGLAQVVQSLSHTHHCWNHGPAQADPELWNHSWSVVLKALQIPETVRVVLCKVVTLHLVGVTFLLRNTRVFAVHVFCHDWDEVQAVWLHLEAGTGLAFVSPGVDGVVGVDGTGQVEGHTQGDRVTGPQTLRRSRVCFPSSANQLLLF